MKMDNHVFTCTGCGRQWTVDSTQELECFFVGLCYWCITDGELEFEDIRAALAALLESNRMKAAVLSRMHALGLTAPTPDNLALLVECFLLWNLAPDNPAFDYNLYSVEASQ